MASILERDALRREVLEALYFLDQGDGVRMDYAHWANVQGLDRTEVERAVVWLRDRGLARQPVSGPFVEISPDGIDAVEQELREKAGAGTRNVVALEVVSISDFRRIESIVGEIRDLLHDRGDELEAEDREDLRAQLDTIDAQKRSPRPRKGVIAAAMVVMLFILKAAAGEMVSQATVEAMREMVRAFQD